jgi:hypothetical protein
MLLTYVYILEATGSNLDRDTDYPVWEFSWFYAVLSGKCRINTWNQAFIASSQVISYILFINRVIIRRWIFWAIDSAIKKVKYFFVFEEYCQHIASIFKAEEDKPSKKATEAGGKQIP